MAPPGSEQGPSATDNYVQLDPNAAMPPFENAATAWDPVMLLDPQHNSVNPPSHAAQRPQLPSVSSVSSIASQHANPADPIFSFANTASSPLYSGNLPPSAPANDLVFHFAGPGTDDGHPLSGDPMNADYNADNVAPPNGPDMSASMASMLGRTFHTQDREVVPDPKRRKVTKSSEYNPGYHSVGGGLLARSVKQEQRDDRSVVVQRAKAEDGEAAAAATATAAAAADTTNGRAVKKESLPAAVIVPNERVRVKDEKPVKREIISLIDVDMGGAQAAAAQGGSDRATVDLTDGARPNFRPSYEEVCYGSVLGVTVECQKTPAPKPGSIALSGPAYWPVVKVILRRPPSKNKNHRVLVADHTRQPFGIFDGRACECFAMLMDIDRVRFRVVAKIQQRRRMDGEAVGRPTRATYPVDMVIYGASTFVRAIGKRLNRFGYPLVKPNHMDPDVRLCLPHLLFSPEELTDTPAPPVTQPRMCLGAPAVKTTEEIRADVLNVFDSMANTEDYPEMNPAPIVKTPLLRHQKQGLYFMVHREKSMAEQAALKFGTSIWQRRMGPGGQSMYFNIITGQVEQRPPTETRGGILADMMGLGKTLSILSLIATSKEMAEQWSGCAPQQPKTPAAKKKANGPIQFEAPTPQMLELTPLKKNGKGTLLVCPLSTVANWEEQLKQHLELGSINYHIYHGQNRIKDVGQLAEFDLVITTYGSVSSELTARSKGKTGHYPLEEIGWFRVVLDEAHMIREQSTLQFKAICRLQANRRWAVTGTPVQNRLDDLGSLLAFIRLKPFDDRYKFNHFIINPFRSCDPNILTKMRVLVDSVTLRRLKDKIDLPPRQDVIARLDFSPEEKVLYDFYSKNASDRLEVLTHNNNRIVGGKTYIHILQAILRLRLICAHGRDLLSDDDLQVMQGTTLESAITLDDDDDFFGEAKRPLAEGQAYGFYNLLVNSDQDNCTRCKRKLGSTDDTSADIRSEKQEDIIAYITPCIHPYCPDCVKYFVDEARQISYKSGHIGNCPQCNEEVVFTCAEIRHERVDDSEDDPTGQRGRGGRRGTKAEKSEGPRLTKAIVESRYSGPHTKTRALVQELLEIKAKSEANPNELPYKSVVFSGWTSHLDLIQIALNNAGISYCRLDGKMSRIARSQAMETFREDPSVHVILVSIMAGGLGLNLTSGNHVFVMEPQYNPAAEAQAIDRVHRLGQKRPVRTVRYVMRDSFEERMLEIQNRKIKVANLSVDRGDRSLNPQEAARQRLDDLRSLFN